MTLSATSIVFVAPAIPLYGINGDGTILYSEKYGSVTESYGVNARKIDNAGNAKWKMHFLGYCTTPSGVQHKIWMVQITGAKAQDVVD